MSQLLEQGGVVLIVLIALSMVAWTFIFRKWLELREETREDMEWTEEALSEIDAGRPAQAAEMARTHTNVHGRLIAAGLEVRSTSRRSFRLRMEPVLESEEAGLYRHLDIVAAVGTVAPLLGLLGTVFGMVKTFAALTLQGVVELHQLTEGISEALLTTQAGLLVALPTLVMHRVLAARFDRHAQGAAGLLHAMEQTLVVHPGRPALKAEG